MLLSSFIEFTPSFLRLEIGGALLDHLLLLLAHGFLTQ